MSYKWVRASEISEFVFCQRAWWFKRVKGKASRSIRRFEEGTRFHKGHNARVRMAVLMRKLVYVILFVVVAILVFQLLYGI